jgi:hypothetical protein
MMRLRERLAETVGDEVGMIVRERERLIFIFNDRQKARSDQ